MTSKIPLIPKVKSMSGIKALAGRRMTKEVKFMGENVTISKLNVSHVRQIQEAAKNLEGAKDDDSFEVLKSIIADGVEGGEELTDEEFESMPLDELSKLSQEILRFSGIGEQARGK